MAKKENHLLPFDKETLLSSVFPSRITTQNRAQTAYDDSLIFPVSLILSLVNRTKKDDICFNKQEFLKMVSENVEVWYRPVKELIDPKDDAKCSFEQLKSIKFKNIKVISPIGDFDGVNERRIGIVLENGYGIVYNPPLLTPTLRNIAIEKGAYSYMCMPVAITNRTQLQLDHVVSIAAWLSSEHDSKEYEKLKAINDLLSGVESKNGKISVKQVKELGLYDKAKDACCDFMEIVLKEFDNHDNSIPTTFRLQLIDERHNHCKIYNESTLLSKTIKILTNSK